MSTKNSYIILLDLLSPKLHNVLDIVTKLHLAVLPLL